MARLKALYREEIVASLMKSLGYTNVMQVPKLQKITLNMGVGEAVNDKKVMKFASPLKFSPSFTLANKFIATHEKMNMNKISKRMTLNIAGMDARIVLNKSIKPLFFRSKQHDRNSSPRKIFSRARQA